MKREDYMILQINRWLNKLIYIDVNKLNKEIKIHILDNQSTDNTIKIIKNLQSKFKNKITLHISKRRTDIATAQRILVKKYLSKYNYCLLANDDDAYNKSYIKELLNLILSSKSILHCCMSVT